MSGNINEKILSVFGSKGFARKQHSLFCFLSSGGIFRDKRIPR
jgi:hypothetical protein